MPIVSCTGGLLPQESEYEREKKIDIIIIIYIMMMIFCGFQASTL
jgi:hypothetical protein